MTETAVTGNRAGTIDHVNVQQVRDALIEVSRQPHWPHVTFAVTWLVGLPVIELADLYRQDGPAVASGDHRSAAAAERTAGDIDQLGQDGWARWRNDGNTWAVSEHPDGIAVAVTIELAEQTARGLLMTISDGTGQVTAIGRWIDGDPIQDALAQQLKTAVAAATD